MVMAKTVIASPFTSATKSRRTDCDNLNLFTRWRYKPQLQSGSHPK